MCILLSAGGKAEHPHGRFIYASSSTHLGAPCSAEVPEHAIAISIAHKGAVHTGPRQRTPLEPVGAERTSSLRQCQILSSVADFVTPAAGAAATACT